MCAPFTLGLNPLGIRRQTAPFLSNTGEHNMRTIIARDAQNKFGELMDTAMQEPVLITRHGRPANVILSAKLYDNLEKIMNEIEDEDCFNVIDEHANDGRLSEQESTNLLDMMMNKK